MENVNWNRYKVSEFEKFDNQIKVLLDLFKRVKNYGINLKNYTLKEVVFIFDRGLKNQYNCYRAYALLPNKIAKKTTAISLDFQCSTYKAYDRHNNKLFNSSSECYIDNYKTGGDYIFVEFEDNLK